MQYLTVEQTVRQNGNRHLERVIAYASAGYPERYYQGSMKKALRNFELANKFKIFDAVLDRLSNDVADYILNGHSRYKIYIDNDEIKIMPIDF